MSDFQGAPSTPLQPRRGGCAPAHPAESCAVAAARTLKERTPASTQPAEGTSLRTPESGGAAAAGEFLSALLFIEAGEEAKETPQVWKSAAV